MTAPRNPEMEAKHQGSSAVMTGYAPHINPVINAILASMASESPVLAHGNDVAPQNVYNGLGVATGSLSL